MRRLPVGAFVALVIATVGAFFVVQHLKVATPLLTGYPRPFPATINPIDGGRCTVATPSGKRMVSFKRMQVSFYLLNRTDDVDVYIEDADGAIVRQIADGVRMRVGRRHSFGWDGRRADGTVVPDGEYYIHVLLIHQSRSVEIANQNTGAAEPVTVSTVAPDLRVTGVSPTTLTPMGKVMIHYAGNAGIRPQVLIYRLGAGGRLRLVKSYAATAKQGTSIWNGTVAGGAPAPAGRYLISLRMVDRTCNTVPPPGAALIVKSLPVVTVR